MKMSLLKLKQLFSSQKGNILASILVAIFITFLCYFVDNCPFPYWDKLNNYSLIRYIISNTFPEKIDRTDAFFINVSYDRQVVDYKYSNGNLVGKIDITDRETLIRFLEIAEKTNSYKYIFLDIRFENGIDTAHDSVLFSLIQRMRDISYSRHSDLQDNDKAISSKAAINDYFTTITSTNFTRYQYLQNGQESAPLRIYTSIDSINHKTIKKWGPFFYSNGKLCQNSPMMRIPEDFWCGHEENGHQNYYDLGPLLLTMFDDEDWELAMKDKIIFVGNFVDDLHDTYAGLQPGSYLIYLAFKQLCNGKQFIPSLFIILMFVIYMIIFLFIINKINLWKYLPFFKQIKSRFATFILSLIGYSAVLSILSIIFYIFFKTTYNIFIPSLVFSITKLFVSYNSQEI